METPQEKPQPPRPQPEQRPPPPPPPPPRPEPSAPPGPAEPPSEPPCPPGKTPADLALEAEGGEIIPAEFSKGPPPLDFASVRPIAAEAPKPAAGPRGIDASPPPIPVLGEAGGPPVPGMAPPGPPSAEEVAFMARLTRHVNVEVNIFKVCLDAVHNYVQFRLRTEPPDSAEVGESMFGPGKRTPLENAVPEVAAEVYRQVRLSMREEDRTGRRGDVLRGLAALVGL